MLTAPRVPPGTYQVRLTVSGRTLTQAFEIVKDPRVQATRRRLARAVRVGEEGPRPPDPRARRRATPARRPLPGRRLGAPRSVAAIKDAATALAQTLTTIENELIQVRSDDPRMFPAKLNYPHRHASSPSLDYADAPRRRRSATSTTTSPSAPRWNSPSSTTASPRRRRLQHPLPRHRGRRDQSRNPRPVADVRTAYPFSILEDVHA